MDKDEFIKQARELGMPEDEIKQHVKYGEKALKKLGVSLLDTDLRAYQMVSRGKSETDPPFPLSPLPV
jgi:hypothetical protein